MEGLHLGVIVAIGNFHEEYELRTSMILTIYSVYEPTCTRTALHTRLARFVLSWVEQEAKRGTCKGCEKMASSGWLIPQISLAFYLVPSDHGFVWACFLYSHLSASTPLRVSPSLSCILIVKNWCSLISFNAFFVALCSPASATHVKKKPDATKELFPAK